MFKKIPHTYVIVFFIIVIAALLTWLLPAGKYVPSSRLVDGKEVKEMRFYYEDDIPQEHKPEKAYEKQSWQVFSALYKGFVKQSGIIVFILMIGGAFWIMNQTKAIDMGILAFLGFTLKFEKSLGIRKSHVDNLIIVLIMLLFSVFGAVFGMSEETIAFTLILVPLAISMGYDSIVGVCMVYVAAHIGFAGAVLNPFTIGIAQGLSDVPLFTGIEYRIFCWFIINIVGIFFVLRYVKKIRKDPSLSLVFKEDDYWRKKETAQSEMLTKTSPKSAWYVHIIISAALIVFTILYPYTTIKIGNSSAHLPLNIILTPLFILTGIISIRRSVHLYILSLLAFTIVYLIMGVMGYGWYIMEIATLFFVLGIACGLAFNKSASDLAREFLDGAKDILSAAVIVGLAGGIIIILEDGGVIDTILYGLSKTMRDIGDVASVGAMYMIQTLINIVIPSGSAKAAITMPIMAPFSDLIGISRQATVMAFQFGDGFTNMITPTSGVLIAVLGVARIPYNKWFKWVLPFIITLIILGFLLLIPTVTMQLNGF